MPCDLEIIAKYKNYVGHVDSGPDDQTGHGSAAVSLLVKTCPNASLYLARDLRTNDPTRIEAIELAIEHEVDIITMALGSKEYEPEIAIAIAKARAQQILILSANSSSRNMEHIHFPAKDHHQVSGILSTNGVNRESRDLNPYPDDRQHSPGMFGENIEIAEDKPLKRGTSYSTSIAASLAAMLLDSSRQETDKVDGLDLFRMKEMRVMTNVTVGMAKESSNGKYKCIRPWDLLKAEFKPSVGLLTDSQRQKQLAWIRGTMERLIEKI
ncbi:hypothetical protein IWW34DRAFT_795378 [Fusarium oxysporum f. sp. albedinis]|nr:hypothetical protein IWW34DRAFT_795378 [Fusarium oxysporum f. sp. albedinis]